MNYKSFIRLGRMLLLLAIQILVLNHLHLFGYATPLILGYMVICMETRVTRMAHLWWGFTTGLLFDMFSNTMGIGAASCTLLAMLKPYIVTRFQPRDVLDSFKPTIHNIGLTSYIAYAAICMAVFHFAFYFLEAFSLHNLLLTLGAMIGSTVVATIIVVCFEYIVHNRKQEREVIK